LSQFGSKDFLLEIAKGNVKGHSLVSVDATNPSTASAFEDLSFNGGTLVYPVAGEQWEILSSSANDAAAGTGVRTVEVFYLDDAWGLQSETKTMNGTSAVTFTATDSFRPIGFGIVARTWGGVPNENDGDITVRVAGGGAIRGVMPTGENVSTDSFYTVPLGKTATIAYGRADVSKNRDARFKFKATDGANNAFRTLINFSGDSQNVEFNLPAKSILLPEKTDIKIIVESTTAVESNTLYQLIVIDNNLVNLA
jgi:hypothetical protein